MSTHGNEHQKSFDLSQRYMKEMVESNKTNYVIKKHGIWEKGIQRKQLKFDHFLYFVVNISNHKKVFCSTMQYDQT